MPELELEIAIILEQFEILEKLLKTVGDAAHSILTTGQSPLNMAIHYKKPKNC